MCSRRLNIKEVKGHTTSNGTAWPGLPLTAEYWRASADRVCVAKEPLADELKWLCLWVRREGRSLRRALRMPHWGGSPALPELSAKGQSSQAQRLEWIAGEVYCLSATTSQFKWSLNGLGKCTNNSVCFVSHHPKPLVTCCTGPGLSKPEQTQVVSAFNTDVL